MADAQARPLQQPIEQIGRAVVATVEEFGYYFMLTVESAYWLFFGWLRGQPVRFSAMAQQMVSIGITATPIVALLSFTIGVMLAIQGIATLEVFGAEDQVVMGIALSITREFAALITAIVVAGRSGSALAARIGTMQVSQEIDALRVMSINPVRYLASPVLAAMLLMVPSLTLISDFAGLLGGAVFTNVELGLSYPAYLDRTFSSLIFDDVRQGLIKSLVFAAIITVIGVSNGFQVTGGAEGVGRATTRSVVLSISYIVLADMLFTYFLNR
jgi:phospholipid/cholesterol/gamma-HCH transport system permease protein